MEIIENDKIIWDQIWENSGEVDYNSIQEDLISTKKSEAWIKYTKLVYEKFGGWEKIHSIELGSGMGWHSFVAASEGANVTLLDYSKSALKLAKKRFDAFNFQATFINGNAFEVILKRRSKFNLAWSFGTAEHFKDDLRQIFFELHFDFIEKDGLTIISCPHKYAINYRLWMYYANKYNLWSFGLEIPYSKKEFVKRLKLSDNTLLDVQYQVGRPCMNKLLNILKGNSKLRYYMFYPFIQASRKLKLRFIPFNLRSIILVAQKK